MVMLTQNEFGKPELKCDKCRNAIPVTEAVALRFTGLETVLMVCIDCAEEVKQRHPTVTCKLAQEFFESLLARRRASRTSSET